MQHLIREKLFIRTGCDDVPEALERLAEQYTCEEKFGKGVSVQRLAERLGVSDISIEDIPSEGLLLPESDGSYRVTLSQEANEMRRKFSLAHECGHIVFHQLVPASRATAHRSTVAITSDEVFVEAACDRFAAATLMPRKMFRAQAKDLPVTIRSIATLAKHFRVSVSAAARRCIEVFPDLDFAMISVDSTNPVDGIRIDRILANFTQYPLWRKSVGALPNDGVIRQAFETRSVTKGWVFVPEGRLRRKLFFEVEPNSHTNTALALVRRRDEPVRFQ